MLTEVVEQPQFLASVLHDVFYDSCLAFGRNDLIERIWGFHYPSPQATVRLHANTPGAGFDPADWPTIKSVLTARQAECAVWVRASTMDTPTGSADAVSAAAVWPRADLWLLRVAVKRGTDLVEVDASNIQLDLRWLDALLPDGYQPTAR